MNKQLIERLIKEIQTNQDPQDIGKLNIPNVMLWMKKSAYEPTTIQRVGKELRHLERSCNTSKPEEVKLFISNKKCSNARKENLVESYAIVIKSLGLKWNQPFYQRYDKKRKAPKEELIDFIIKHVKFPLNLKLAMSKDLGQRPIELTWLKVEDIDLTTGISNITGAKHTVGREGKLKPFTIELLKRFIKRDNLNSKSTIFPTTSDNLSEEYRHARNLLAKKYNMPELKTVCLYDFRRFKASKEYKLSRHNFLHIKNLLGHRDSRSTEKYISLFDDKNITWIPVICHNQEEIEQAIKEDCELVCQANGITYFKKPA
jgi:integrase